MLPLIKKYQPKSIEDIKGQDKAVKNINDFIQNFKKNKKNSILVYGPNGTGKTSGIYVIAKKFDYEIFEVNASDVRNKEQIEKKIGSAVKQQSLFSKGKIILIDEIDGLSGTKDRGGVQAIVKLIQESSFPIILTANDPWGNKFSTLRKKCDLIEFVPLDYKDIFLILKDICKNEKIRYKDDDLKGLARRAGGDARAAINDLQILTQSTKSLEKEILDELSERNKEESILNALVKVLKTKDPFIALKAFENVKENIDEQFLWLDANVPAEYEKAEDIYRAYDAMSKADVFRGRIRRWQHWRFLVYINELLTAGIALAKDDKYKKFVKYKPTGRLLKLWWAKQKNMKKKAISEKIAEKTHASVKEVMKDFEFYKVIAKDKKIIKELDLGREEVEWLRK